MMKPTAQRRLEQAKEVLHTVKYPLLTHYGLQGVGVGLRTVNGEVTDEPVIKTFVSKKLAPDQVPAGLKIPRRIADSGVDTDVEEIGVITSPPFRTPEVEHLEARLLKADSKRKRPVTAGSSVSHALGSLGTVTAIVSDNLAPSTRAVLSCNHVLAQLNRGLYGDAVVQPAAGDGGAIPLDVCAALTRYIPIRFGSTLTPNFVDAAIAHLPPQVELGAVNIAGVSAGSAVQPGEAIYKIGRTTGLSRGTVVATHVSLWINYPPILGGATLGYALFEDQIMTTSIAGFGDSGSLVLDAQKRAIGMLFGGSATRTLVNDISHVQKALGVRLLIS